MQIKFASVMVEEQEKALQFYTGVLGFEKAEDLPEGEYRWTVRSPEGIDGAELVLEPMSFSPARIYEKELYEAGIPAMHSPRRTSRPKSSASRRGGGVPGRADQHGIVQVGDL